MVAAVLRLFMWFCQLNFISNTKFHEAVYARHYIPSNAWTKTVSFSGISSRVVCAAMARPNGAYSFKYDEEQETCELGSADLINSGPDQDTSIYVQDKPESELLN